MPFYRYRCQSCEKVTTALRKITMREMGPACSCGHPTRLMITATQIAPVHGGGSGSGITRVTKTLPK